MRRDREYILLVFVVAVSLLFPAVSRGMVDSRLKAEILKSLKEVVPLKVVIDDVKVVGGDPAYSASIEKVISVEPVRFVPPSRAVYSAVVEDEAGKRRTLVCDVKYDTLVKVFVSSRPLSRGTMITKKDFYALPQRASRVPVGSVTDPSELLGKRLKTSIGKGVVFRTRYLEDGVTVKRGQKVKIEIRGGSVVITAPGKLSERGKIGEVVRVFCEFSRKELSGILVSPRKVLVTL